MYDPVPEHYSEPGTWRRRTRPGVTWTLIASTVAVFLVQLSILYFYNADALGNALAFSPRAWAEGRYWTLVTYAWAHATVLFGESDLFWLHIMANMVPLYCLGPALEEYLGHWRFLGLYLGGVIASALVWAFFNSSDVDEGGVIGASGAIFALVGAAGTIAPRTRVTVYLFYVLPLNMNLRTLAMVACGIEAAQIVFGWLPEVAHSAHLGGATFGFFYVLFVRLIRQRT